MYATLHQAEMVGTVREGIGLLWRTVYPPEAEPTYDRAKQAAEAGDYPKPIAYGLMHVTEMPSFQNSRLDEIVHLMKRPEGR